jgi:hypothetical protein
MGEQELRKREARLTEREARLVRRERDLAAREAELARDADDDHVTAALRSLLAPASAARSERVAMLAQIAVALWLMVAPLALGYARDDPRGATVACGAALALLTLWRLQGRAGAAVPAMWLGAGVATILIAVAGLADRSAMGAANDALVGLVAWSLLIAEWVRRLTAPAMDGPPRP